MTDKQKYIERFKKIYFDKTSENVSDQKSIEYFELLVSLVSNIYKPLAKEKTNNR
jgi:hypothetical protein